VLRVRILAEKKTSFCRYT